LQHTHRFSWKAFFRKTELSCKKCGYNHKVRARTRGITGAIGAIAGCLAGDVTKDFFLDLCPNWQGKIIAFLVFILAYFMAFMLSYAGLFLIEFIRYRHAD
jgi:hypothetical protein